MQWFRMYAEFANDPKVQMLSEVDQRRYVMLLCLRCSNGDVTLHETEVAFQLRISDDEWSKTKEVLLAKNLIDESNSPVGWDKRQYVSDSSAARVRAHRERKKETPKNARNGDVTLQKRPQIQKQIQNKKEEPNGSSKESAQDEFEALWADWQPFEMVKGNKAKAEEAWKKHVWKAGVDPGAVRAAAKAYCAECRRVESKTQHVVTWLNQDGWKGVEAALKPADAGESIALQRVRGFFETGLWQPGWGDPPDADGVDKPYLKHAAVGELLAKRYGRAAA